MVKNKLCFVIMPFSSTDVCSKEEWTSIFKNVHKSAITESRNGYNCERSNIRPGAFIKDILMQLNQADVVLADLTGMKPNVFYELGVRHTLKNRTILVSQTLDDIPSDLQPYGVIEYDTTPEGVAEYKKEISKILKEIKNNPERGDNPVSDFIHQQNIVNEKLEAKAIEKKLMALISECSFNLSIISNSISYLKSQKGRIITHRFRLPALELLTSTYYIYPSDYYIKQANYFAFIFMKDNTLLDVMNDENFQSSAKEMVLKEFPELKLLLNDFMRQTSKILKDFRNQNFIEPAELTICVAEDEHKELLDI